MYTYIVNAGREYCIAIKRSKGEIVYVRGTKVEHAGARSADFLAGSADKE